MTEIKRILDEIELHDLPLDGLKLNFETEIFELIVSKYCDDCNEYKSLSIQFKEMKKLQFQDFDSYDDMEINTYNLKKEGDEYLIEIIMLLGFAMPSWSVKFSFKDVEVVKLKDCKCHSIT